MANSKSAKKRILINNRNRRENLYYKTSVRTLTKMFLKNVRLYKEDNDSIAKQDLKKTVNSIFSLIDKGVKRRVFHRNTAAHKKARLIAYLKTI